MPLLSLLVPAAGLAVDLFTKSRSRATRSSSLARARTGETRSLDASQQDVAVLIVAEVQRAHTLRPQWPWSPRALAIAAITNAYAESRLRPDAWNSRGEDSVGLFQVNRQGALGSSYSRAQLRDARTNTRIILSEVDRQAERLATARTVGDLTAAFCTHVERPADAARKAQERVELARSLFGNQAVDSRSSS